MKNQEKQFANKRKKMVKDQLITGGISDKSVLEAMGKVPRHLFMDKDTRSQAYKNKATWIGEGQTISQPYIVAMMTEMLILSGKEKVLEIGTGSGYQSAILAELSQEVFSIERHKKLADLAQIRLDEMGYQNINLIVGDGTIGLQEHSPFQAILVTAAAPKVPQKLLDQLDDGGRMVIPVGSEWQQKLTLIHRNGDRFIEVEKISVVFVPLIGEDAWREEEWDRRRKT